MKIAAITAHPTSAHPTWAVTTPSFIRSRNAETTCETGLTDVNVWSHPGRVLTGTNALDRNAKGNMISMDRPWTAPAVLVMVPIHMKIQATDQPVTTASANPAATPGTPPPGR